MPSSTLSEPPVLPAATRIVAGRYRLIRPLGRGFLGETFLAGAAAPLQADPSAGSRKPDTHVVLKLLHPERGDPISEATTRLLAGQVHPNLAQLIDSGTDGETGRKFLVLPWIEGTDWVAAAQLAPTGEIPLLLAPVCRGLVHVHEHGMVHGRLHGGNCLVRRRSGDGEPAAVLLDFGLDPSTDPEGPRHDFTALGWMLIDALVPAPRLHGAGDVRAPKNGSLLSDLVREVVETASPVLAYVIRRCLEIDSGAPFQSAAEILDELNRRAGLDLSIQPPELRQSLVFEGPFVGRAAPMDRLKLRLEALVGGSLGVPISPMAILVGEGGVGKSRLMKEFLAHAAKKNLTIHSGACLQSFRHPYTPLEPVIRSLADSLQQRRESEGHPQDALHPLLSKYGSELVKISPRLGAQHSLKASATLEPEHEKMRLIDQTCCFIHDASRSSPILLALEDVHCSDEGTLDLLRYLCRASRGGSVHILAAARREDVSESPLRRFVDEGSGEGWLEQISVERLSDEDLTKLANQLIPLEGSPRGDLYTRICAEASGNPHYLQEILRSLVEEGVLSRSGRKWSFAPDRLGSVGIPHRLAEGFLDRVQRLEIPQVQLVRLLAAYGRPASVDQLSRMLDRPRWETQRQSEDLVDRAILERSLPGGATSYAFRNGRYGEALLRLVEPDVRRDLHGCVAEELKACLAKDDLAGRAHLARHLLAAGETKEAIELGIAVGHELLRCNAVLEVMELSQFLRNCNSLDTTQRARILNLAARTHVQRGDLAGARGLYEQALAESTAVNLQEEAVVSLVGLSYAKLWNPDINIQKSGMNDARTAYQYLCRGKNPGLLKRLLSTWAGYFVEKGQFDVAYRLLERSRKVKGGAETEDWETMILTNQAITAAFQGKLRAAESMLDRVLKGVQGSKDINLEVMALGNSAHVKRLSGDCARARSLLERAQTCIDRGAKKYEVFIRPATAANLAAQGELLDAEQELRSLLDDPRVKLKQNLLVGIASELGRVLLHLGCGDEVSGVLDGLSQIAEGGLGLHEMHKVMLLKAWARTGQGDHGGALAALQECSFRAREVGSRRNEAEALAEMLLHCSAAIGPAEEEGIARRLTEIARDGESHLELIGARIAQARVLERTGGYGEADELLEEAFEESERRGTGIWTLWIVNERWRISRMSRNDAVRRECEKVASGRIEPILQTIGTEALREKFLRSPLAAVYSQVGATAPRNVTSATEPVDSGEQARIVERFLEARERAAGLTWFVEGVQPRPYLLAIRSNRGVLIENVGGETGSRLAEKVQVQIKRSLKAHFEERQGVPVARQLLRWLPLEIESEVRWRAAMVVDRGEALCLVYAFRADPGAQEIACSKLAALFAAQLTPKRDEPRGAMRVGGSAPRDDEIPDDPLLVGRSAVIRRVLSKVRLSARGNVGVLIQGESGTGKELVARRIHQLSSRASGPFIAIDCGAIPENLIESELFGYRKGAFTGADRDKPGIFEDVGQGTLLLDEIGNAGSNLQAKLLRVLQEGEVRRIGETRPRPVDVRVVGATNADLRKESAAGRFREDLLYRLSVVTIDVPPLRERLEDVPLLATVFLHEIQTKGMKAASLTREALEALMGHRWPGNVRELGNALQAAALAADGAPILPEHLPESVFERGKQTTNSAPSSSPTGLPPETDADRERLLDALRQVGGDKSAACRILGWNRMKLYRRLKRYNLPLNLGKSEKA